MRAGTLRHVFEILEPIETRGRLGGNTQDFKSISKYRGQIIPLRGKELEIAQQIHSATSHKIVMRYCPGLQKKWRVLFCGRTFNIVAIINTGERNRKMELFAEEVAAE